MRKYAIHLFSFVFSILLIYLLLSKIDINHLIQSLVNINPLYYALSILIYYFVLLIATYKIKLFLPQINSHFLLLIICAHNLVNRILPFRIGEAVLPIMLKKGINISLTDSMGAVFSIKLLDLIVSLFMFFLLFISLGLGGQKFLFLGFILILIFMGLIIYFKKILKFLIDIIYRIFNSRYILKFIQTPSKEKVMNSINHSYTQLLLLTVLRKTILILFSIIVIKSVNYDLIIRDIIFASISSGFTEIIPINSLGSFGTLELGWAGALIYFGIPAEIAIESGFSFHFVAFSIAVGFGLISTFILFFYKKYFFK